VRGNQAGVKNADVRHPSSTVVIHRRKSASPFHNVVKKDTFAKITFPLFVGLTFQLLREIEGRCAGRSADMRLLANTW
jgi:hypothetical protein